MKKILIITMLLVFAVSSASFAASARWNAMGAEHRFILDTSNYGIYPGRMLMFSDALWIIPNLPSGYVPGDMMAGLLVKRDDMAWALHYNLPGTMGFDALRKGLAAAAAGANLNGLRDYLIPFPDVFVAKKMGDMTVGGRVVLGLAGTEPVTDKTASAMSVDVAGGATMPMAGGDLDVGVRISLASFSDDSADLESTGGFGLNLDARLLKPKSEAKTLIPLVSAQFGSKPTVKDSDSEVSYFGAEVGLGTMCKSKSLLVYGVLLGMSSQTTTPPVGDEASTTTMTVAYLTGYEKPIKSWLIGRGGAKASLNMTSGDDHSKNGRSGSFYYNFGIRAMYKKVLLDVLLDHAILHRGPYILTGSGGSWSSNVCLTYLLGGDK